MTASNRSKKAWITRKANSQKRSQAAVKANRTRKLTKRALKAWDTRRSRNIASCGFDATNDIRGSKNVKKIASK